MFNNFELVSSKEINSLKEILSNEVHKDFLMIQFLDKGIIYLHGKLPTKIKEYLEYKFHQIKELRFVIANTVILEGINLPIDNMFIHNTHGLSAKKLVNLIGRVNRLNYIFCECFINNLNKLNPKIHFINSKNYKNHNLKLKSLRNRIFKDNISNPLLIENSQLDEALKGILDKEEFIDENYDDEFNSIKKYFIQKSLDIYYFDINATVDSFIRKREIVKKSQEFKSINVIDKIYLLFIEDQINNISNLEFRRLKDKAAREYYIFYKKVIYKLNLKESIKKMIEILQKKSKSGQPLLYFGRSYGDVPFQTSEYKGNLKVYTDLSNKSYKDFVNLSIVKIKLEEDFIKFTLNKFVEILFDKELINKEEYELFIYGSNNPKEVNLHKFGISKSLILKLVKDKQINNLTLDSFGNLNCTKKFQDYLKSLNDFEKFELERSLI